MNKRKPKSELETIKAELVEAEDRLYRYEAMLVDLFHNEGWFTDEVKGRVRYLCEAYDCWIP